MPDLSIINTLGSTAGQVPVTISLHIIKHFSAGLYTSPNKAFEELVTNSYDAYADIVQILFPFNVESDDAFIGVVDNGTSMDVEGFKELWSIGKSKKREEAVAPPSGEEARPPIGKFGIGKLATYVLARELSYLTKTKDGYHAITMDFGRLEADPDAQNLTLDARDLTEAEAKRITQSLFVDSPPAFSLFGKAAESTWTIAVMRQLRPLALKLSEGRLKWVLRTALPLNPRFNLFFRQDKLESPKIDREKLSEWIIGQDDQVAASCGFSTREIELGKEKVPAVEIDKLGPVWGEFQLYKDPLPGGKAEDTGRSHGFFVLVRKRLINEHEELFGLEQLSHGAWARFRMVLHANGLDDELRATREAVNEENEGVKNVRKYMKACFNHARVSYNNWLDNAPENQTLPARLSKTARGLSREPLFRAIRASLVDPNKSLHLSRIPRQLDEQSRNALLEELETHFKSEEFFSSVEFDDMLGVDDPMAVFDVESRSFRINISHPFYANYSNHYKNPEPFNVLAITEVLSEAYLLDEGLSLDQARDFLDRRDRFLRELVLSTRLSAALVAQLLDDNKADEKGLEKALHEGFKSLGFEVTPMGKTGDPDGKALARLGFRTEQGKDETYTITYDSKSSAKKRIKAHTVGTGTIELHKFKNGADFALVVAPGFEGADDPESNISLESIRQDITCIELKDFILLILLSSVRPIGFLRLRDEFFIKCHTPAECTEWIEKLVREPEPENPLSDILEVLWEQQSSSPEPPTAQSVRQQLALRDATKYKDLLSSEVKDWMRSVMTIVGSGVTVDGDRLNIDSPPHIILQRIQGQKSQLPQAYMSQIEKLRHKE